MTMWIMIVQSGPRSAQAVRWAARMGGEANGYLDGQPVVRVFGPKVSTFSTRLTEYIGFLDTWQRPLTGQKTMISMVTRPATFLAFIVVVGTALISAGAMDAVALLPFLFLGTTFGSRLLGISYGLLGLRTGMLAARRIQLVLDEPDMGWPSEPVKADQASAEQPSQRVVARRG